MSSRASLLGLPVELRLEIYKLVLGATRADPQWPCCSEHCGKNDWHFAEDMPAQNQIFRPTGLASLGHLLCVNHQIHSEELQIVQPTLQANFCITVDDGCEDRCLFGMGTVFYGNFHTFGDTRLLNMVSMLSKVQLDIRAYELPSLFHPAGLSAYPDISACFWDPLVFQDTLRLFIKALNASRNLKLVNVRYYYFLDESVKGLDIAGLHQFEQLRDEIELHITIHELEKDQPPLLSYPSHMAEYLQTLKGRRSEEFARPHVDLMDHWIKLRQWIVRAFPFLFDDYESPRYSDLVVDGNTVVSAAWLDQMLRCAIVRAWHAHDRGSLHDFNAAQKSISYAFRLHSVLTLRMLDDLQNC